jgi:trimeric autotransporter adhesin
VVIGTVSNTYTTPGITSSASKAAQSGPTRVVTSDALGNLAVGGAAPASAFDGIATTATFDTNAINSRLNQLSRQIAKAYTGTAMAFAMSAAPTLLPGKKFALSGNFSTFQANYGAGITGAMRISNDIQLNGAFAYGFRENMSGGRVGMSYQW